MAATNNSNLTLGQRISLAKLLTYRFPERIDLNGGRCEGHDHNSLPDTYTRDVSLLFVIKSINGNLTPLCEWCYNHEHKLAHKAVQRVNLGLKELMTSFSQQTKVA